LKTSMRILGKYSISTPEYQPKVSESRHDNKIP
jgi:hypothetical protein